MISGADHFLFDQPVNIGEQEIPLAIGRITDAGTVQIRFTTDQQFKGNPVCPKFDPKIKRSAFLVALLGFSEQIIGERQPEHPIHKTGFQGPFQVVLNIVPLLPGHVIDKDLSQFSVLIAI